MTPEEKAIHLVRQYYCFVSGWTSTNTPDEAPSAQYEGEKMKIGRAKQCALIVVNEIIEELKTNKRLSKIGDITIFWDAVKRSLNAL